MCTSGRYRNLERGFKEVGVAHKAAKGGCCISSFSRGGEKFFYYEAILEHSETYYFSATESDSPHFHEQTSTA